MKRSIVFSLLLFVVVSCAKDNDEPSESTMQIPVTYYLTDQDKSLFDWFFSNQTISFVDGNNNHIIFHADSIFDITTHPVNNLMDGEQLQINYVCQSNNYFPNYKIILALTALANQEVSLGILFGTGTYWNDHNNDYVLSSFGFYPKTLAPFDSIDSNGTVFHYDYADSLTLGGTDFYSVFYDSNQMINTDLEQTKTCYYGLNDGVIGFYNLDGRLWVKE